jgi:cellulose synthase/poly-beta-1,6-N-acetylglucosamine synthase-like glycosyltransferase
MIVLEVLFWLALTWLAYVFVLYPVGMALVARLRPRPLRTTDAPLPRVAFVMAAYNEEKVIATRIENYLDLDYPRELMEFHIGSDGSSDRTDEIIQSYIERDPSIHLHRYNRVGKTRIIYEISERLDTDIFVFTDADIIINRDALRHVVRCFSDPDVGGVVGDIEFVDNRGNAGSTGERKFTRLESSLKANEALAWTTISPTGLCFAVRPGAFTPLENYKLSDDLNLVITIGLNGYRVWFEPRLVITELNNRTLGSETSRRLRMGQQSMATYLSFPALRLPWRSRVGFQIWSHKLLRNLAAVPAVLLVGSAFALAWSSPLYAVAAALGALWLVLVAFGMLWERLGLDFPVLLYPLYFTSMVGSLTIGSIRAAFSGGLEMWSSPRLE